MSEDDERADRAAKIDESQTSDTWREGVYAGEIICECRPGAPSDFHQFHLLGYMKAHCSVHCLLVVFISILCSDKLHNIT